MNSHAAKNNSKRVSQDDNQAENSHNAENAAHMARNKVDRIYEANPPHQDEEETKADSTSNKGISGTYNKHISHSPEHFDWKTYHNAWQDYYQKYYQRYYIQYLQAEKQRLSNEHGRTVSTNVNTGKDEKNSTQEFKSELLNKISQRAKKARRSSHFLPIASALTVGLLFLVFNYNVLLAAQVNTYISPSQNVSDRMIVDPQSSVPISKEPRLIIPKINVDAPLVFGLKSLDNATTQIALKDGVVHYPLPGADSLPGQTGNGVYLGHSSNTIWDDGDWKFVFVLLPRLEKGDIYYINYNGTRYAYKVVRKEVIMPNQIDKLILNTDKPMSTLVGCVPIGTNLKRLLVFAEQISPDPSTAEKVQRSEAPPQKDIEIPGTSGTFLQSIFGS
jgi:sortase A